MAAAVARDRAAGACAQRLPPRPLSPAGDHPRRAASGTAVPRQSGMVAQHGRLHPAGGHLHAYRRHRPGADRAGRLLRAGGQRPHALGRQLHARKPRDHDGDVPRAVHARGGGERLELSPPPRAQPRRLRARRHAGQADHRGADARYLQFRLLRTRLPGRADGGRAGRGKRFARRGRAGRDADHQRLSAGRRALSPGGRRFSRPTDLPARQRARRTWHHGRLSRRRHHHRQCAGHGHFRRQGDLLLHAGDRRVLHRREAPAAQCRNLPLRRPGKLQIRPRQPCRTGRQGSARLGRLRDADRPRGEQGRTGGVPQEAGSTPGKLHRAADARAFDLSDFHREGPRAAPCGPAALRPRLARCGGDHARRADPRCHDQGIAGGELKSGRRHQRYLGAEGLMGEARSC